MRVHIKYDGRSILESIIDSSCLEHNLKTCWPDHVTINRSVQGRFDDSPKRYKEKSKFLLLLAKTLRDSRQFAYSAYSNVSPYFQSVTGKEK